MAEPATVLEQLVAQGEKQARGTRPRRRRSPSVPHFLSVQEVAERYGRSIWDVYRALKDGRLTGMKVGWNWVIEASTLPASWPR